MIFYSRSSPFSSKAHVLYHFCKSYLHNRTQWILILWRLSKVWCQQGSVTGPSFLMVGTHDRRCLQLFPEMYYYASPTLRSETTLPLKPHSTYVKNNHKTDQIRCSARECVPPTYEDRQTCCGFIALQEDCDIEGHWVSIGNRVCGLRDLWRVERAHTHSHTHTHSNPHTQTRRLESDKWRL